MVEHDQDVRNCSVAITTTLPAWLVAQLDELADREQTSRASIMRYAIGSHVASNLVFRGRALVSAEGRVFDPDDLR